MLIRYRKAARLSGQQRLVPNIFLAVVLPLAGCGGGGGDGTSPVRDYVWPDH